METTKHSALVAWFKNLKNFPPLKVIGFAFRKDKGTLKSGAKENNPMGGDGVRDGREIGVITFLAWLSDCLFDVSAAKNPQQAKGYLFLLWLIAIANLFLMFYSIGNS